MPIQDTAGENSQTQVKIQQKNTMNVQNGDDIGMQNGGENPIEEQNDDDFDASKIVCVITKGKGSCTEYSISLNIDGETLEYISDATRELLHFVQYLEKKIKLNDIRFVHDNHLIALIETQQNVWALPLKKSVYIYINNQKYLVDLNNEKNKEGNNWFRERDFEKAQQCYTISSKRYPTHLKPLVNRALCYYNLDKPLSCIKDCDQFIKLSEEYRQQNKLQSGDDNLTGKAFFRSARSYFKLGTMLLNKKKKKDLVADSDDSDGGDQNGQANENHILENAEDEKYLNSLIDNVEVQCVIPDNTHSDMMDEGESDEYEPLDDLTVKALKLLKKACDNFVNLEASEFESKSEVSSEFDMSINAFVCRYPKVIIPCCPLCRSPISEDNKLVFSNLIPTEIAQKLLHSQSNVDPSQNTNTNSSNSSSNSSSSDEIEKLRKKSASLLNKNYPIYCETCASPILLAEQKFLKEIWNPFYQNPQLSMSVSDTNGWINVVAASTAWKQLICKDLIEMGFNDKTNLVLRKAYTKIRKILLSQTEKIKLQSQDILKSYLFVSTDANSNTTETMSDVEKYYLTESKFESNQIYDPKLQDQIVVLHTKLGHFHLCTILSENYQFDTSEWPLECETSRFVNCKNILSYAKFTIQKEGARPRLPRILLGHIKDISNKSAD